MKGLVLAGGKGTRLRPLTHTGPKQLVPVGNDPVLVRAVADLRDAGITDIGVVLGNKGREAVQDCLGDGSEYGVDITYIVQGDPLGIAHAIGCARSFVGDDDFVVYLGDNVLENGVEALVDSFASGDYATGVALHEVDNPEQFGVAVVDDDGTLERVVEKPDDPPSNLAVIGVWAFSPAVFDAIERLEPSSRGELEVTDAIQSLLEEGHPVDSHVVEGWWKDTGKPEDVLAANRLVLDDSEGSLDGTVADGADVVGDVDLHETATIENDTVVRGPVSIGADAVVRSGAYLGPYTAIGDGTVVENAHVENTVVVGDARITTRGRIVDSLIGEGASVTDADELRPEGTRLTVGEDSDVKL